MWINLPWSITPYLWVRCTTSLILVLHQEYNCILHFKFIHTIPHTEDSYRSMVHSKSKIYRIFSIPCFITIGSPQLTNGCCLLKANRSSAVYWVYIYSPYSQKHQNLSLFHFCTRVNLKVLKVSVSPNTSSYMLSRFILTSISVLICLPPYTPLTPNRSKLC